MTKSMLSFAPGGISGPFTRPELRTLLHVLEHGQARGKVYIKPGSAPVPYREGKPLRWRARISIGQNVPAFACHTVNGEEEFEERDDAEAHACRVANSFARDMGDAMPSYEFVVNVRGLSS